MKLRRFVCVFLVLIFALACFPAAAFSLTVSDGADVSYEAASESMVLLKNERSALPLTSDDKIAIFGEGQVFTNGMYGGFYIMGRGSGRFPLSETPKSPCDILTSYVAKGLLGGVYAPLCASYKKAAAKVDVSVDFQYSPSQEEYDSAAKYANKAIFIVNRSTGESKDVPIDEYGLTKTELSQLKKICAAFNGKPVIVVLNSGLVVNCDFANGRVDGVYADSVITAPYMGIRGTNVLCDTLVGLINPSGKTVDTYAKNITDYIGYKDFYSSKDKVDYIEDIYVGYRYFETFDVDVDYPFGYGLSYTSFEYSDIKYTEKDGTITVFVRVTNTGNVSGKESVQLYFSAPQKGVGGAVISKAAKELCGFAKTQMLSPGESQVLTMSFNVDSMSSYDDIGRTGHKSAYILEAGDYSIYVGSSVKHTVLAGVHTEQQLRVVEQLNEYCEPDSVFEYITFDGKEKTLGSAVLDNRVLHSVTNAKMTFPSEPYRFSSVVNGDITIAQFLSQMTNDELCEIAVISPTFSTGAWGGSQAVAEKYGIPLANSADGPAGLRVGTKASGIPSETALACSWNLELATKVAEMVAREMLISDVQVWLSPGVNIHRFPLCGRNFEYYSEDPYLSGAFAAAVIQSVENNGVATCVKHFVGNEREWERSHASSNITERALREIYLVPFKMAVDAGVSTVMTGYNRLNGIECSENAELIRGILRREWGFDGMITTDWSNSGSELVNEIIAGNNVRSAVSMSWLSTDGLRKAVNQWKISRSLLIENATYVMELVEKLPAAQRLLDTNIITIKRDGTTVIEAEDYSLKHAYGRFEVNNNITLMSYMQATDDFLPWIEFLVDVDAAGSYILSVNTANAASKQTGDSIRVFVDGVEALSTYTGGSTGGWYTWQNKEICRLDLEKGNHAIKIKCADAKGSGNYNYFSITPISEVYSPISNADDVIDLMNSPKSWGGKYYLTNDIDLTGVEKQSPIGTTSKNFSGVFDGCGYSISGIDISSETERDLGLFGKTKNAVIRSLKVNGKVVSTCAKAVVGGIVGTADPGTIIADCVNNCVVTYSSNSDAKGIGGVVGYIYSSSAKISTVVKDCINNGTVNCENGTAIANTGGIVGYMNNGGGGMSEVLRCVNYGEIIAMGSNFGAIVGTMNQASTGGGCIVSNCVDNSTVKGIVGVNTTASKDETKKSRIENCIDEGEAVYLTDKFAYVNTPDGVALTSLALLEFGDSDGNGAVNFRDLLNVARGALGTYQIPNAELVDANANGKADVEDLKAIFVKLLFNAFQK